MNNRTPEQIATEVRDFWFGGKPGPEREEWFLKNEAFDAEIRERFLGDMEAAATGRLDDLAAQPAGCVALCILLDQFPRNVYRGTPRAFATDSKALEVARRAVEHGLDASLVPVERLFLYLPFEHSENLADQERAVELIGALGHEGWLDYAVRHRDIIARFGRFPHRNDILGRPSTPEEIEFLKKPGSSF